MVSGISGSMILASIHLSTVGRKIHNISLISRLLNSTDSVIPFREIYRSSDTIALLRFSGCAVYDCLRCFRVITALSISKSSSSGLDSSSSLIFSNPSRSERGKVYLRGRGYNGLIYASDFGLCVPPFPVQTVPLFTVRFVPL